MSCFAAYTAGTNVVDADPTKHVNYTLGMVLGVDDFTQEFAYLAGRDQWMTRDFVGYGTVRGLRLSIEVDAVKGPRAVVAEGAAASTKGRLICVPAAQCAYLNQWLAAHAKDIPSQLGIISPLSSPLSAAISGTLSLYVVLCFRECPTDDVPIPGEPCRSEDELMAPSRLADSFALELRFAPPRQREEDAVRDFVEWLRKIQVTDIVAASSPVESFLDALRDAANPWLASSAMTLESPPPDFMSGEPPAWLRIRPEDLCEYMRAAFRLWVTELRPKWMGRWSGCGDVSETSGASDDCVLLGELRVPVIGGGPVTGWVVDGLQHIQVDERRRPFVLHTRMLQEWLLCGVCGGTGGAAPASPLAASVNTIPGPPGPQGPPGPLGPAGAAGPAGADGAVGPIGPAGPAGADGAVGPIGPAGPAGADGAVGPIGPAGPAGADGAVGPIGPAGPAGADGAVGPIGPAGPTGADGAVGPIGPAGPTGADGAVGPIGPAGPTGADGAVGPIGPAGPTGADGAVGPIGPASPAGADGAVGPIGPAGPAGADGAIGPIGPAGPQGVPGPQGPLGPVGPTGNVGPIGATGPQGATGPIGPIGPLGPAGPLGPQGAQGIQGLPGPPGPAAIGNFVEHPTNSPYFIVAAGIIPLDGPSGVFREYNGLTASTISATTVSLTFGGYRDPNLTRRPYIVKVLPVRDDRARVPIVRFLRFDTAGIVLEVTDLGSVIPGLKAMELMVEISQYA